LTAVYPYDKLPGKGTWVFVSGTFFSCPLDDRHAIAALRYMERNPVRAGIVGNAWEYPWSSAAYHSGIKRKDRIVKDSELIERGRPWQELLAVAAEEEGFIRKRSRTGRPCGEKDFMKICEKLTGRNLHPLKPGPRRREPI
jgi:putative transposase